MARKGVSESSNASSFELNQMIEFWSKGGSVDDQSRNIAQDLLECALKLQESLVMLGRLQEASKFMARSKKMANPSNHGEEYEKKNVGASDTVSGFDGSNYRSLSQLNYRKLSIDGSSSMDSFRDFKSVLRDGLSNQISSSRRERSFREVGVRAEKIGSGRFQNSSIHEKSPENKLPTVNHDDSARHCIEEIKKVIKDSLVKQSLLSVSSDEDQKFSLDRRQFDVHSELHSSSSCTSFSDPPESQRKVEQPMKTSKASNLIAKLMGLEEFAARTAQSASQESDNKKSYHLRKPVFDIQMPKVMNSPITDRVGDRGRKELKDIIESMRYKGLLRNTPTRDYYLTSRSWNATEELPPIVVIKPLPIAVNEGKERGNFLAKSVFSEIKNQGLKQGVSRSVGNDIQSVEAGGKNSVKSKTPAHNNIAQQRTNSLARKSDKLQNNSRDGRNLIENLNRKSSQGMNTPIKARFRQSRKPEIPSVPKKNPVYRSASTRDIDLLPSRQCTLEVSVDHSPRLGTNNGKMQRNPATKTVAKKKVQKEVVKGSDMAEQHNNLSIADTLAQNMVQISKESANVCNDIEGKYPSKAGAGDMPGVSFTTTEKNYHKGENVLFVASTDTHDRQLLLSNTVFLEKVEKFFGLQTEKHSRFLSSSIVNKDGEDDIILLDCAYELLERKNSETLLSSHPLLQIPLKCKRKISLDELVDEVIDGIATWRWGSKSIDTDSSRIDSLYWILGKDLMCNSMVANGVWDMGWLNGLSVKEAEVVVNEVGKDIEVELIEEIVISLVDRFH